MHLGQRQGLVQWQISSLMDKIRDKTNKRYHIDHFPRFKIYLQFCEIETFDKCSVWKDTKACKYTISFIGNMMGLQPKISMWGNLCLHFLAHWHKLYSFLSSCKNVVTKLLKDISYTRLWNVQSDTSKIWSARRCSKIRKYHKECMWSLILAPRKF